jgi:hypothetical protein
LLFRGIEKPTEVAKDMEMHASQCKIALQIV